ncbi:pre-mRNA-splicing factor CLF1-like [Trifolium pratense]|uniref:pre-mRNA-splicing factor CLF1-like n=1 Tax=Trifolium pratense TaxID=57577 RepID=UPI001E691FFB|nr:pre-mRNA-splicing factor CLF1-like [Trifolium pratense]
MWKDWFDAQQRKQPNRNSNTLQHSSRWQKPVQGWIKCNIDASFFMEESITSLACCFRNASGEFLKAQTKWINAKLSTIEGEGMAFLEAISFDVQNGWDKIIFESDSQILVDCIHANQVGVSEFSYITNRIRASLSRINNFEVKINYALYEELDAGNMERTRVVYSFDFHLFRECLNQIPHHKFSFAKVWLLAAQFEIRQLNLKGARQILGNAIGKAPKSKIFKKYIEMELQLSNIDRCRKLYEKYLQWSPENCYAWSKYAELERSLSETDRARAIFDLAIGQPALDMPELLWKTYIDFEISEFEFERARGLYERLLDRTKHLKVWISYADFEATATDKRCLDLSEQEQKKQCIQRARRVFEEALNYFRSSAPDLKEERAMLLDKWINLEVSSGELGDVSLVQSKLPKKLKKRRQVSTEEDGSSRIEEFIDYLFPEETQTTNLKILEAAYKWKKQKL